MKFVSGNKTLRVPPIDNIWGVINIWRQNGKLHRLNGPSNTWLDGTVRWCQNGEWHRLDGPAVIRPNGYRSWYQNNRFIRSEG